MTLYTSYNFSYYNITIPLAVMYDKFIFKLYYFHSQNKFILLLFKFILSYQSISS